MVLNAAVQTLKEADELKEKILTFKPGTSMLQERGLWALQQQLQQVYQKVLVLDLDYALNKKVEQDLWNIGFKQQIEALQSITKDRKNQLRSDAQAMLSWVLQAAAGFYLCLLHQLCTAFKLDLPFRRRASLLGWTEGWGATVPNAVNPSAAPPAARYITQHCLVHLGDLARYSQQLRVAHTFYRHALVVSAHSGQPYNQLALLSWRRGRKLGALYWHVRSLLVRAPFPPAATNLARTLQNATRETKDLPVLPGITPSEAPRPSTQLLSTRLDAHSYVEYFIRALHLIYTMDDLEGAEQIVNILNSSKSALVATDSFDSMTLIKMACISMWLVDWSTEQLTLDEATVTRPEAQAASLSQSLAAGAILALLLPTYTADEPPKKALPALKVWLSWLSVHGRVIEGRGFSSRPQLWPALATTLNALPTHLQDHKAYDAIPLSEDVEVYGFVPLESALEGLRFPEHGAVPTGIPASVERSPLEISQSSLENNPELECRVRAYRLVELAKKLADMRPGLLSYSTTDERVTFASCASGGEQLTEAVAALQKPAPASDPLSDDSDDSQPSPPPPKVISEADFREKVREKRVGILKPQGSLERAREERAQAVTTQDELVVDVVEKEKSEDSKVVARKPRMNVAMAAIMRKQEETNKQVKFVTPPPTPDSLAEADTIPKESDKPKVIKTVKTLDKIPTDRKTGGILSLKDKSAGYPHLVNSEPEPKKVEEKKENKPIKKQESWPTTPTFEQPRQNFVHKNYAAPGFSGLQPTQGIRLPVVNPKEIDVRSAALQKQHSRLEGQEKFNPGYMSEDKKNFLNDLPPRFANQYRYWQNPPDNQFKTQDNKFRDENPNSLFGQTRPWPQPQIPEFQQPTWWKPENPPPNYNQMSLPNQMNMPNFYSHLAPNQNPYASYNQMGKPETMVPGYLQSQPIQGLVPPNFGALNNFGFAQPVRYDSSMYPQFDKMGYNQPQMKMPDKPMPQFSGNKDMDMGFRNDGPRNPNPNFNEPPQNLEQPDNRLGNSGSNPLSTYSLFSGTPQPGWNQPHQLPMQQSLWGPGPSPLERLLEQQKKGKPEPQ